MSRTLASSSRCQTTLWLAQVRRYATPVKTKTNLNKIKTKQGSFKMKKKTEGFGNPNDQAPVKANNPGSYRPMNVNGLQHPVFMSGSRVDLTATLPMFQPAAIKRETVGKVLQYPMNEDDAFRRFGLPKSILLEYRLLSAPCSVVRDVTVDTAELLDRASQGSSAENVHVLTGDPGCGKSFLLLQSVEYCLANDWIVLYIPRAINLVDSLTRYVYDRRTQLYAQPVYSYQTLQRFLTVNGNKLKKMKTKSPISIEKQLPLTLDRTTRTTLRQRQEVLPVGTPLVDLINRGLENQSIAPTVLDAVLTELSAQTEHPVLLAVDDFQAVYCKTAYKDAQFDTIKPFHLSIPRLILEYSSGERAFARGAILGALSTSNTLYPAPLELRDALGLDEGTNRVQGEWVLRRGAYVAYAKNLKALPVPNKLSVEEAASLYGVWMHDNAFQFHGHDETFMAKYAESSGNARSFVAKGILASMDS